jgi:beta-phosphoglucomutase-like phosphatase (HAD superfamily)
MKDKVILVDCDGVLLDWEYAFHIWMKRHGHTVAEDGWSTYNISDRYNLPDGKKMIRMFNESAAIGFLPPLRDAIHYVRKLHEHHGYIFHAITSLSTDPAAQNLRTENLKRLFGKTVFERFVYLDTGADKDEALAEYRDTGCFWVEDKPENAVAGIKQGLEGILVAHEHNNWYRGDAQRVQTWKEIYYMVTRG